MARRKKPEPEPQTAKCAKCLKPCSLEEYFAGDFYCSECALAVEDYPLQSTPAVKG